MLNVAKLAAPSFDVNNLASLVLDLSKPNPKDIVALVGTFEEAAKTHTLGDLPVTTGWNEITPAIAVDLLLRNRPGANRKVDPTTVIYYARQMARGQWKATGQPILVDKDGRLVDAQHRLFAGVIAGVMFPSYVVTGITPIPNLFAYIDNARARSAASALQTAGYNGVAASIVKVIKIAEEVRLGVYNPSGLQKLERQTPAEILELAANYPNAQKAARSAASDWEETVKLLGGRKDVVAYCGMLIIDQYGEEVADDFFSDVVTETDDADDPILALRKLAEKDAREAKPLKRHYMLAALIKVFNAWQKGVPLGRRWMLQVNEDFPVLDAPEASSVAEAA